MCYWLYSCRGSVTLLCRPIYDLPKAWQIYYYKPPEYQFFHCFAFNIRPKMSLLYTVYAPIFSLSVSYNILSFPVYLSDYLTRVPQSTYISKSVPQLK
jgi:hypothetical protein